MAPYSDGNDGNSRRAWTRRDVLKRGALTLAGLGLGNLGLGNGAIAAALPELSPTVGQALAGPTGRKRAVLVGINRYGSDTLDWGKGQGSLGLQGCLTDVALMRDVLVSRFGFEPGDILTLTDGEATRSAIKDGINQFLGPLTAQDTAFFHFSGCGTEWVWPQGSPSGTEAGFSGELQRSRALVPADGRLPKGATDTLRDLPVAEVLQALAAGGSNRTVAVIDAGNGSGGGLLGPGVGRGRSRLGPCQGLLSEVDQRRLQDPDRPLRQWSKGLILDGGRGSSNAVELPWGKVWAGALTYQLAQTLWHLTPGRTLWIDLAPTLAQVNRAVGDRERPIALRRQPFDAVDRGTAGVFPLVPTPLVPGAAGQIIAGEGQSPRFYLGGVDPLLLAHTAVGSLFEALTPLPPSAAISPTAAPPTASPPTEAIATVFPHWQLRDRQGLTGRLTGLGSVPELVPGQRLQERGRLLPTDLNLVVAVDTTLKRIERVDAISALTGIAHIDIASESQTQADIAFGRHRQGPLTPANGSGDSPGSGVSNRYGLFSVGGTVIPSTLMAGDEAVKIAVQRLEPLLRARLAEKWLRLTDNQYQTAIALQLRLRPSNPSEPSLQPPLLIATPAFGPPDISLPPQDTTRSPSPSPRNTMPYTLGVPRGPSGRALQYELTNRGDQTLYPLIFVFDEAGGAFGFVPSQDWAIAPGKTQSLFQESPWSLPGRQTLITSYVLTNQRPWKRVQEQWELIQRQKGLSGMVALRNPLALVKGAIADLGETCPLSLPTGESTGDRPLLDLHQWATLKLSYRLT